MENHIREAADVDAEEEENETVKIWVVPLRQMVIKIEMSVSMHRLPAIVQRPLVYFMS